MKSLQATRPDLAEAILEITRQKEQLIDKLIGYKPSIQGIKENGEILLHKQGGTTFSWQGKPLVRFDECKWESINDAHGSRIKAVIEYKINEDTD